MKKSHFILSFAFLTILLSSCSPKLTPFTQELYDENGWDRSELKKIQFYVSRDIVLRREASKGVSKIESGEIKIINGKRVEQIVIKKGTPGVYVFSPKDDRFAISFESREGAEDPYLIFGSSKNTRGRYALRARDWEKNQRGGKITYAGNIYRTTSESAYASLLVDLKRIRNTKVKSRTADGRTVRR